ncbi:MAG: NAD(P)H-dependent oxidoreductase subunit E [Candidatus Afipia apatlaquensis]|uniref:NAD(P)H-dependent oxidoreductase subunit E n=1 Tax=Candidatus Afipia apatlaquensis TaxID=2712852 RepID=A0A7C9RG58_9BRAD|nr:NAD(P)H-dependent oxidoreductase subunit E [Candidatus Afipia apatlaquensis]
MDNDKDVIEAIERNGSTPDKLIEVLIDVQNHSGENYISEGKLRAVSDALRVPLGKAYGVASFYSMLSTKKRGRYVIQVCNSVPCHIYRSMDIVKALEDVLQIKAGEVTPDGIFSLEYTDCIGNCAEPPSMKINDRVYGNLDYNKVVSIIDSIRKEGV